LSSLISNISSKQTPKRAYFSNLPFEIAPGLTVSVNGYIVLHRQTIARSCYVYLEGERAQIASGETTKVEPESTKSVEKSEIKKAYKFGGEFVHFSPEELKDLKNFKYKGLRIIGFKSRSLLPPWASIKPSTFIFPSEVDYVGSSRVFSALWQKLIKSNKMAIAWAITRVNANPLLVAILPSKGQTDETSGTPFLPAGLWLYPLPFVDDLRDLDSIKPKQVHRASNDLIDQTRVIVQNLQLPKAIYNPS
jgi:ATP-dependent DNA helicase 2 subunit 1